MKETTSQKIAKTILRRPFYTAFIVGILLSFIAWAWLFHPVSESQKANFAFGTTLFVLSFWALIGTLVSFLQDSFITYLQDDWRYDNKKILLKVENGKIVATGDCFWGTSGIHLVSVEKYPFSVETSIVCKVGLYCKVTIPVTVFIENEAGATDTGLKPYNYQELYDRVIEGKKVNSVEDFVKRLIEESINYNQQSFDYYAHEYTEQKISSATLLQKIIVLLSFPYYALRNFDSFKICLDDPTVSTCKSLP